jgi:hypothetical protein
MCFVVSPAVDRDLFEHGVVANVSEGQRCERSARIRRGLRSTIYLTGDSFLDRHIGLQIQQSIVDIVSDITIILCQSILRPEERLYPNSIIIHHKSSLTSSSVGINDA